MAAPTTGWRARRRDEAAIRVRRTSRLAHHAVAQVDDSRAEGARLDEFEIHPALALGKERNATANQHRVDPGPVLVDQTQRGRLGGERRAADRDVALPRLGSQPLDLLRQAAGGQAGIALHRRQRGGEHHLWERLPDRGPLELCVVERWILVGGLPVQHRLVQLSSQQVDADLSYLVGDEAEDLLVGRRRSDVAVRPGDVAVKRDAHRIGHAAHQKSSSVTGSTIPPPDAAGLIAARRISWAATAAEQRYLAAAFLRGSPQPRLTNRS